MTRLTDKPSDVHGRKPSPEKEISSTQSKDMVQQRQDIPQFDLAEQILAEQRKLSSVRRKGPAKKPKVPAPQKVESSVRPIEQSLICSEQEQIIAEIVARDVEHLLKGKNMNGS